MDPSYPRITCFIHDNHLVLDEFLGYWSHDLYICTYLLTWTEGRLNSAAPYILGHFRIEKGAIRAGERERRMARSLGVWSWPDVWVLAIKTLEQVTFFAPEVPRPQDLLGSPLKPPLYKLSLNLFSEKCRHLSCWGQQSQGCLARKHSAPFRTVLGCLLGTASLAPVP